MFLSFYWVYSLSLVYAILLLNTQCSFRFPVYVSKHRTVTIVHNMCFLHLTQKVHFMSQCIFFFFNRRNEMSLLFIRALLCIDFGFVSCKLFRFSFTIAIFNVVVVDVNSKWNKTLLLWFCPSGIKSRDKRIFHTILYIRYYNLNKIINRLWHILA